MLQKLNLQCSFNKIADMEDTVLLIDDGFSELLKWNDSNLCPITNFLAVVRLSSDIYMWQMLFLLAPKSIIVLVSAPLSESVSLVRNILNKKNIVCPISILTNCPPDIYSGRLDGTQYSSLNLDARLEKKMRIDYFPCHLLHLISNCSNLHNVESSSPLASQQKSGCELYLTSSGVCRNVFPVTIQELRCSQVPRQSFEHKSIDDIVAEDIPTTKRNALRTLAQDLVGALVFDLGLNPSGKVSAIGKTSSLLGHTLQPILAEVLKHKEDIAKHSHLRSSSSGPGMNANSASNGEYSVEPASLVIIDRTRDLWTPAAHSNVYAPLGHRILSTLPRQSQSGERNGTVSSSVGSVDSIHQTKPMMPSTTHSERDSYLLTDISLRWNDVLSTAQSDSGGTGSMEDVYSDNLPMQHTCSGTVSSQSSSAIRGLPWQLSPTLCSPPDSPLRRILFSFPEEEGRVSLCSMLEEKVLAEAGTIPPPKKRGIGAAVLALVQSLMNAPGAEGSSACTDTATATNSMVAKHMDILAPSLAVVEAMQRSSAKQPTAGTKDSTPCLESNRSIFDIRKRIEADMDSAATKGGGAEAGCAALLSYLAPHTASRARPVPGASKEGAAATRPDLQLVFLLLIRLSSSHGCPSPPLLTSLWSTLTGVIIDTCCRQELLACLFLSLELVDDIILYRTNKNTTSATSATATGSTVSSQVEEETRWRLQLELEDILEGFGEALREVGALRCECTSPSSSIPRDDKLGLLATLVQRILPLPSTGESSSVSSASPASLTGLKELGLQHLEDPLLQLARAGLGLLSQGLGRFGFSNNVTPKDTKNPVDTHTVVLFVIGGVSLAEAGEVNQVIRSFHEHDSLGRNSKKRIILISNSLLSTDSCYSQVISNMMNK